MSHIKSGTSDEGVGYKCMGADMLGIYPGGERVRLLRASNYHAVERLQSRYNVEGLGKKVEIMIKYGQFGKKKVEKK